MQAQTTAFPAPPAETGVRRESLKLPGGALRWWRAPLWFLALFTGAKSFADNPILGSAALNRAGLHGWRVRAAHALTRWRRARLSHLVPEHLRDQFDRDGFVVVKDVLPPEDFRRLQKAILDSEFECRAHQQGDTVTRRVALGPELLRRIPALAAVLASPRWSGLMAYVAGSRNRPLYYIQTISGGIAEGPVDPQLQLHADTFHPSLKAWLFLTDVEDDGRPLTYVAGSHRLSGARLVWERRKSVEVLQSGDRLSQRGSFRIRPDELDELGLPQPTRFSVPANTLVIADTCGFHARADSNHATVRVELWAFCRRNPFLPWTGGGLLSWPVLADRRADLLYKLMDWLDRRGVAKQHWKRAGQRRPIDA
ncbi:MAG TPA: phytanoyl-CoA dioxygenase family protein [Sphingomicrobium sp.]|nr:phytanoyl-CoA dioxygenase family protein [Sphingomicrobium sp.]